MASSKWHPGTYVPSFRRDIFFGTNNFPLCLMPMTPRYQRPWHQRVQDADRHVNAALKLPPSRNGYGIIVKAAVDLAIQLQGNPETSVAFQFYTANVPCGDGQDDAVGHGTLCAGIAAGSLPSR